jgi:hypothetical protein
MICDIRPNRRYAQARFLKRRVISPGPIRKQKTPNSHCATEEFPAAFSQRTEPALAIFVDGERRIKLQ